MIYVTGTNGFIGSNFVNHCRLPMKFISYRENVEDVFESHNTTCLVHLGWSTTPRVPYTEIETAIKNDVLSSKKLFDYFSHKNPNGKIIFLSSAGDLLSGYERTVNEETPPSPRTLYGECKLQVENILKVINCDTVSLRVSNVWGGNDLPKDRKNGLVDKLIQSLDKDEVVEIYGNLESRVDLIHVTDLCELILKVIESPVPFQHQTYVVGAQSLTIREIIDRISSQGTLLLRLRKNESKSYVHIENSLVRRMFEWNPKVKL